MGIEEVYSSQVEEELILSQQGHLPRTSLIHLARKGIKKIKKREKLSRKAFLGISLAEQLPRILLGRNQVQVLCLPARVLVLSKRPAIQCLEMLSPQAPNHLEEAQPQILSRNHLTQKIPQNPKRKHLSQKQIRNQLQQPVSLVSDLPLKQQAVLQAVPQPPLCLVKHLTQHQVQTQSHPKKHNLLWKKSRSLWVSPRKS